MYASAKSGIGSQATSSCQMIGNLVFHFLSFFLSIWEQLMEITANA